MDFCINDKKIKIALTKFPSISEQIKIINKITRNQNKFGILLSDKKKVECLKKVNLKSLKIFEIKKAYEIPYKIDKAVKKGIEFANIIKNNPINKKILSPKNFKVIVNKAIE